MGLSTNTYTYTGGPKTFAVNFADGFLERDHVTVYRVGDVDGMGNQVYLTFTWNSDAEVLVSDALSNGDEITVERTVEKQNLIVDLDNPGALTREALERNARQTLHAVHEALDGRWDYNLREVVTTARDETVAARDAAETARDQAQGFADDADLDADRATNRASDALTYRDQARTARDTASGHATTAGEARDQAQTAAGTASGAATAAQTSANDANTAASAAATSATNAGTSEANALTYRNQAQDAADSINAAVMPFANRPAVVTWVASNTAPDGTVISDGVVQYVAKAGATAIADMPGWLPFGDVYTAHFRTNQTPGTTDMGAAIEAADVYCAASNVPLHWDGTTHFYDPTATVQITPSAEWRGDAVISIGAKPATDNSVVVLCGAGFTFDSVSLSVAGNNARVISLTGNVRGASLVVNCTSYTAVNDSNDAAVIISGDSNRVDNVTVSNHGRLLRNSGTHTVLGSFTGRDYVQGFLNNGDGTRVGSLVCTGKNVNSSGASGENGLLHSGGNNCWYGFVRVEDSGEHAVRLGGSASYSGVSFGTVMGLRPAGNAFKVRPDATFTANFTVGRIVAEDCGSGTLTIAAQDVGVLIERALHSRIDSIEVRKSAQSKSCYSALEVNNVDSVSVGYLRASDVAYSFISVRTEDGDVNGFAVDDFYGTSSDAVAVSIVYPGSSNTIRDIRVSGAAHGISAETIRTVRQIDGTYTAADYMRGGVDPGGSGAIGQTCRVNIIAPGVNDIDGNGKDRRGLVYTVRERVGSTINGPSRFVDVDGGRLVYYLNNVPNDGVSTVDLPPRDMKAKLSVFESNTSAGALGIAAAGVGTASSNLTEHLASNASASATNGTLSGTTGTAGTLNYRLDGTTLYVENRRGATVDVVVSVELLQSQ
jgi:hypothetical protein